MSDGASGLSAGGRAGRCLVLFAAVACLAALGFVCFRPVLCGGEQFGFRDAGDFYYPLYERVEREWRAGRVPLWEPEENGGTPLLANPAAAVFYPGKLLYAVLPYPWAARGYVVAHLLLAAAAQYAFLRALAISRSGAALGGLSYGFSAPVLALCSNVIFLVGAAWLPLGFLAAERWLRTGRRTAFAGLVLVLGLLTLGGDPETAYLIVLSAVVYVFCLSGGEHGPGRRQVAAALLGSLALAAVCFGMAWWEAGAGRGLGRGLVQAVFWTVAGALVLARAWRKRWAWGWETRLLGLAAAGAFALVLAAVQVVPTLEFIARSSRSTEAGPEDVYRFSLVPVEVLGALWPNLTGAFGSENTSWLGVLPPKHQWSAWSPSVYFGLPSLALALAAAGARAPRWRGWLVGVAIVGVLASLGEYGSPLLWARWIAGPGTILGPVGPEAGVSHGPLADGVGGVYWLLGALMPGFRTFRYPAKLVVPACVALTALAGFGWNEIEQGRRRATLRVAAALTIAGVLALGLVAANRSALASALRRGASEAVTAYGPLDETGAVSAMIAALAHGTAAGLALWLLARRPGRPGTFRSGALLVVLTVDLALANRWVVMTVPQALFDAPPRLAQSIGRAERAHPGPDPFRIHRMIWSPTAWSLERSAGRPAAIVAWEHDTLRPKYGILRGLSYTYSVGTAELSETAQLFNPTRFALDGEAARMYGLKPGQHFIYHYRRAFDMWNTRYFIVPARLALNSTHRGYLAFLPHAEEIDPPPGAIDEARDPERARRWLFEEDVQLLRNEDAYPRAWVVHRARTRPPGKDPRARRDVLEEIAYQGDELWFEPGRTVHDPRRVAWVETGQPAVLQAALSKADPDPTERVTVVRYEPQEVELAVTLKSAGLVILADTDYPGWRLEVDGKPSPILRTNLAMRGALVGKGAHRLVYRYVPRSFQLGSALSLLGLAALVWTTLPGLVRATTGASARRDSAPGHDP